MPGNHRVYAALCFIIVLFAASAGASWAIYGVHIADLSANPHPPNPVRIWGKVISVTPLKITDGKGVVEVTGKTAAIGEYLVLDGSWNGTVFAVSTPTTYTGDMVQIPSGSFLMGNSNAGGDALDGSPFPQEYPQHSVYLSAYSIGKYEVTRGEYKKFIDAGGYSNQSYWSSDGWSWKVAWNCTQPAYWAASQNFNTGVFTQTDNHPVVGVSYYEAEAFCNWAGGHLPTEAQWEKAARWTGSYPNAYPWADNWDPDKCNNYFDHNTAGGGSSKYQTAPVGSYPASVSPYGCQDMAGNAWEWCQDWYGSTYYSETLPGGWNNPTGPTNGVSRVLRGGSFAGWYVDCRCAYRNFLLPYNADNASGFRLAR